jgi:hypothetical protein
MVKRVLFGVIGVVLGIVAGMIFMMSLHMASTLVYPLPEGVSFMGQEPANQARLKEWFSTLPTGAFLLAIACHGLGCMAGAFVAMLVSGRRSLVPPLIVGVFFTMGGIMNLSSIPHPSWFAFVDLPIYLVLASVAGLLLKRKGDEGAPATTP